MHGLAIMTTVVSEVLPIPHERIGAANAKESIAYVVVQEGAGQPWS